MTDICDLETFLNRQKQSCSLAEVLNLNKISLDIVNNESKRTSSPFLQIYDEICGIAVELKKQNFMWTITHAETLKNWFKAFENIGSPMYVYFGNVEIYRKDFTPEFFNILLNSSNLQVGDAIYDTFCKGASYAMSFFNHSMFLKDWCLITRIDTENCYLYDPIFRQKIRYMNTKNLELMEKYFDETFDIKEYLYLNINKFIPSANWRWACQDFSAHIHALNLFVSLFEYGLWGLEDIDRLCDIFDHVARNMETLENYLHIDANLIDSQYYFMQQIDFCIKAREAIAAALLHVILLIIDDDVDDKLLQFNVKTSFLREPGRRCPKFNFSAVRNLFKFSTFDERTLYSKFTDILVSYVARYKFIKKGFQSIESDKLSKIMTMLMSYMTNVSDDFYLTSLSMLNSEDILSYYIEENHYIYIQAKQLMNELEIVVQRVRGLKIQGNDGYCDFARDCTTIFNKILVFIRFEYYLRGELILRPVTKLAATQYNIPTYVVILMAFLSELALHTDADIEIMFTKGFELLRELSVNNNPCTVQLLSGDIYEFLIKFEGTRLIQTLDLFEQIIKTSTSYKIINYKNELLDDLLKIYHDSIQLLSHEYKLLGQTEIKPVPLNENTQIAFKCSTIISEFFRKPSLNTIKNRLKVADSLRYLVRDVHAIFSELNLSLEELDGYGNITKYLNIIAKPESDPTKIDNPTVFNNKLIFVEAIRLLFNLFNNATDSLYSFETLTLMKEVTELYPLSSFYKFMDDPRTIQIMEELFRFYSNCTVFPENHLLDNRLEEFGNPGNHGTEIRLSSKNLNEKIITELTTISQKLKEFIDKDKNYLVIGFIESSFLPTVYKFYSSLMNMFIVEEHRDKKEALISAVKAIYILKLLLKVDMNLSRSNKKTWKNLIKNSYEARDLPENNYINYSKMLKKNKLNYFHSEHYGTDMKNERALICDFLLDILRYYSKGLEALPIIEKLIDVDQIAASSTVDREMIHKQYKKLLKKTEDKDDNDNYLKRVVKFDEPDKCNINLDLVRLYKKTKNYYTLNPNKNICIKSLRTPDLMRNTLVSYISYFFAAIYKLEFDYHNAIYTLLMDPNFISSIQVLKELISTSGDYRKAFYDFLTDKSRNDLITEITEDMKIKVMRRLWALHKNLYYLVSFKTIKEQDCVEIYKLFSIVSNFIKDLCEDNHVGFKLWFQSNSIDIYDYSSSFFKDYYDTFVAAFKQTRLHINKSEILLVSDHLDLMPVLNRMMTGMTELINGGSDWGPQPLLYENIEIWIGIILRVINNVNSFFYQLKLNVIIYMLSLVETKNNLAFEVIAENLPVSELYDMMLKVTKKLLIALNTGFHARKINNEVHDDNMSFEEFNLENYNIESTEKLLYLYMQRDEDFSNHSVLEGVVKCYIFIKKLAVKDDLYSHFVEEMNAQVYMKRNKKADEAKNLEGIFLWGFLMRIVCPVEINCPITEIIIIKNKIDNSMNMGSNRSIPLGDLKCDDDVEIESTKQVLQIIYFKKLPESFFISNATKSEFRNDVNIDSLEEKHKGFFEKCEEFDLDTFNMKSICNRSFFFYTLASEDIFKAYMILLYLIALTLNLMLLVCYENTTNDFNNERGNLNYPRYILTIIQVIVASTSGLLWFIIKYDTIRTIRWMQHKKVRKTKAYSIWDILKINIYDSIISVGVIQTFILHVVFGLLGLIVSPFFYTLQLLLIVHLSNIVYSVVLSFMNNYTKLLATLLIIAFVINSFSYLIAQYYRSEFLADDSGNSSTVCYNYYSCWLNSLNLGMRTGSGLAEYMVLKTRGKASTYIGRLVFDVVFFIMVNLILLGIFFGIIVDSFKELRDDITKRNTDEKEICFTCGMGRSDFERKGINFSQHKETHDIWMYFFYQQYLWRKPKNDYDGIEIYVSNLVDKKLNNVWMPIGKSLELENIENKR